MCTLIDKNYSWEGTFQLEEKTEENSQLREKSQNDIQVLEKKISEAKKLIESERAKGEIRVTASADILWKLN